MACSLCSIEATSEKRETLHVGISHDAPPFEYEKDSELLGFDVDLIKMIACEMDVNVEFLPMSFGGILGAIQTGYADVGMSSFEITPERSTVFDFSNPYYQASASAVFLKTLPVKVTADLEKHKIGCQLGSTFEKFVKASFFKSEIISMDTLSQLSEALKAGHIDMIVLDEIHAKIVAKENDKLASISIPEAKKLSSGYGIACKKGSPWKAKIDKAIHSLEKQGKIKMLQDKWLKDLSWKSS